MIHREAVMGGPTIGENDFQALFTLCGRLTSYISFAENLGKLHEVDNTPTMRDILLRLDEPMQARWTARWTGKRSKCTQHIKDLLHFLENETKRNLYPCGDGTAGILLRYTYGRRTTR